MESHLHLQTDNAIGRVLHITDTHLFADKRAELLGINTYASFHAVMDEICDQQSVFDLIVATGDFIQDKSIKGYEYFAERIVQFNKPCVYLQGNHDEPSFMEQVFSDYGLLNNKTVLLNNDWVLVLLNSRVEGAAYGYLAESELKLLLDTVNLYPNRHVMVFLHHHPVASGCNWLDAHCLKNSGDLAQIVRQHPQIKSMGWGHIHQTMNRTWYQCQVFSTPSTCVQFEANCHDFKLSTRAPGWRMIDLFDGDAIIKTVTHHIELCDEFLPDMSQSGY